MWRNIFDYGWLGWGPISTELIGGALFLGMHHKCCPILQRPWLAIVPFIVRPWFLLQLDMKRQSILAPKRRIIYYTFEMQHSIQFYSLVKKTKHVLSLGSLVKNWIDWSRNRDGDMHSIMSMNFLYEQIVESFADF